MTLALIALSVAFDVSPRIRYEGFCCSSLNFDHFKAFGLSSAFLYIA